MLDMRHSTLQRRTIMKNYDLTYWEEGENFLINLGVSSDSDDQEMYHLIRALTHHREASIGLLINEPSASRSYMRLIRKGKKRRVITDLRKMLARRNKQAKLARQREIRQARETYRLLPDLPKGVYLG
jgi:hypothetical protein